MYAASNAVVLLFLMENLNEEQAFMTLWSVVLLGFTKTALFKVVCWGFEVQS